VNSSSLYKRLIWLILLLLPDDRPVTRRAVMRAGVWLRKQRGTLTLTQRKALVEKGRKEYKTSISIGVGLLSVVFQYPFTMLVFVVVIGWWLQSAISWCVQRLMG